MKKGHDLHDVGDVQGAAQRRRRRQVEREAGVTASARGGTGAGWRSEGPRVRRPRHMIIVECGSRRCRGRRVSVQGQ